MLIPTYYLLSKICDIFATRRRILLKINKNYFRGGRGGQVRLVTNNDYKKSGVTQVVTPLFVFSGMIVVRA